MDEAQFISLLGLEIETVTPQLAVGSLVVSSRHLQPYGLVHGGVYCSIVETLGSLGGTAWAIENGMFGSVGVANQTDFLRSTKGGTLRGEGTPLHQGRINQLWQVVITREDGKIAARGNLRLHNVSELP